MYCVEATATTADHVIGRKFFLANRRDKLPIVPACQQCNREKARLEDHLMVVLGFAHSRMDKRMEAQAKIIEAMGLNEKTARVCLLRSRRHDGQAPQAVGALLQRNPKFHPLGTRMWIPSGYRHLVEAERLRSHTISRAQKELILIQ